MAFGQGWFVKRTFIVWPSCERQLKSAAPAIEPVKTTHDARAAIFDAAARLFLKNFMSIISSQISVIFLNDVSPPDENAGAYLSLPVGEDLLRDRISSLKTDGS
ncbi:hypothetical protein [Agrobacterium leguminum]|uniref:hypothetical protein n=1 Tax=Agrobacterium leguminum TaxID=2792015 RepID=UPI003CE5185A